MGERVPSEEVVEANRALAGYVHRLEGQRELRIREWLAEHLMELAELVAVDAAVARVVGDREHLAQHRHVLGGHALVRRRQVHAAREGLALEPVDLGEQRRHLRLGLVERIARVRTLDTAVLHWQRHIRERHDVRRRRRRAGHPAGHPACRHCTCAKLCAHGDGRFTILS